MRTLKTIVAICSVVALASCTGTHNRQATPGLPFPKAYPRPNLPDTTLISAADTPLHFMVNAEADLSSPRDGWLDINYPTLDATVHVTFTSADAPQIEAVKENRMERLMLNAGDRFTDFKEFSNPAGFNILTAYTENSSTPLQFLATDNRAWVVSGVVYFHNPKASTSLDSVKPMIRAINYDLTRALNEMDYR